jgi:hypothetical protein
MPVYVIGSDDPKNLGKISTNLCPYFSTTLATVQVQSINTVANIEILNDDDYIDFEVPSATVRADISYRLDVLTNTNAEYAYIPNKTYTHLEDDEFFNSNVHLKFSHKLKSSTEKFQLQQMIAIHVYSQGPESILSFDFDKGWFMAPFKDMSDLHFIHSTHFSVMQDNPYEIFYYIPQNFVPIDGDTFKIDSPKFEVALKTGVNEYEYTIGESGNTIAIKFAEHLSLTDQSQTGYSWSQYPVVEHPQLYAYKSENENQMLFKEISNVLPDDGTQIISESFGIDFTLHDLGGSITQTIDLDLTPDKLEVTTNFPQLNFAELFTPIIHGTPFEQRRFKGSSRLGLSWEAVTNMINSRFREQGIGLTADFAASKIFRLRHLNEKFTIHGMSYNFEVLLGFLGLNSYPLVSQQKSFIDHYANLAADPISKFRIDLTEETIEGDQKPKKRIYLPLLTEATKDTHTILGVIPIVIETAHGHPPMYKLQYSLDWGTQTKIWCQIHPISGTLQMLYVKDPPANPTVTAKVTLSQGDGGAPLFTELVTIHGCVGPETEADENLYKISAGKTRIVFDEKIRVGVEFHSKAQDPDSFSVVSWVLSSNIFLKFTTPVDQDGNGIDDGRTCMIQALHERTSEAQIYAIIRHDHKVEPLPPITIEIISDQVEYTAQVIDAPVVGVSLSTPQLYLLTNIGYQMFKNSMLKPKQLDSVQVAAILQNTFSAGLYMSGSGDFPIVMNDADSANLTFTLCDANYHPIKLLSPLYLILKVDPTPNPVEDISQWNQLLPRVRKPQVEILYTVPRVNITEHPNLLNSWVTATGIL